MILKGLLFVILFPIVILLFGDWFLRSLKWKRTFFSSLSWGYVLMLAVFQIVAFPLFRLNSSFSLLFWMFTLLIGLSLLLILISVIIRQRKSEDSFLLIYKQKISAFLTNCKRYPFLAVLLIFSILFCVFMSEGFYYSSSDEGYNIPRAMEAVAQNSLGVNDVLSWRGVYSNTAPPYNNASTYYFFIAWLSCIFGIHTTVLYKTFLLLILIGLHLSAICTMYDSVKPEHQCRESVMSGL